MFAFSVTLIYRFEVTVTLFGLYLRCLYMGWQPRTARSGSRSRLWTRRVTLALPRQVMHLNCVRAVYLHPDSLWTACVMNGFYSTLLPPPTPPVSVKVMPSNCICDACLQTYSLKISISRRDDVTGQHLPCFGLKRRWQFYAKARSRTCLWIRCVVLAILD